MKRFLFILMVMLFIFSCAKDHTTIYTDMAELDKAYASALIKTKSDNTEVAAKSVATLSIAFSSFADKYEGYMKRDKEWDIDLAQIEIIITEAAGVIASEAPIIEAHHRLEEIREIFYRMRSRNNMILYADALTVFHTVMEDVVGMAGALKQYTDAQSSATTKEVYKTEAKENSETVLKEIKKLSAKQANSFRAVENLEGFSADVYGFSEEEVTKLHTLIEKTRSSIQSLNEYLEDKETVASLSVSELNEKAEEVKKYYSALFKLCGAVE